MGNINFRFGHYSFGNYKMCYTNTVKIILFCFGITLAVIMVYFCLRLVRLRVFMVLRSWVTPGGTWGILCSARIELG